MLVNYRVMFMHWVVVIPKINYCLYKMNNVIIINNKQIAFRTKKKETKRQGQKRIKGKMADAETEPTTTTTMYV